MCIYFFELLQRLPNNIHLSSHNNSININLSVCMHIVTSPRFFTYASRSTCFLTTQFTLKPFTSYLSYTGGDYYFNYYKATISMWSLLQRVHQSGASEETQRTISFLNWTTRNIPGEGELRYRKSNKYYVIIHSLTY